MKKRIYLVVLLLSFNKANAQFATASLNEKNKIDVKLKFERAALGLDSNFMSIRILDVRDDSSNIGLYSTGKMGKDWPKLYQIMPYAGHQIHDWMLNYFSTSTKISSQYFLLVVIKKLCLSSEALPAMNEDGKTLQTKESGFRAGLVTQIEYYLGKDSFFYPMYKTDSVFNYKEELPVFADFYVTESLKRSVQRLFKINFNSVLLKGKKLTMENIEAKNNQFLHSEITSAEKFVKGVYKSFDDFKANKPSFGDYEMRPGAMGDVLYVKEANSEYPMRNAWGYCDGTFIYVNSGDKYFKLFKNQSGFYFAGFKGIERELRHDIAYTSLLNLATNTGRKVTKFTKVVKYHKLDMETGNIY